jgi:hypothetical protein
MKTTHKFDHKQAQDSWIGVGRAISELIYLYISKIRIKFLQAQQCFTNKIKPLHVSANNSHHRKATNTSMEMLHTYCIHVVMYRLR